jgi:hypothetical protein
VEIAGVFPLNNNYMYGIGQKGGVSVRCIQGAYALSVWHWTLMLALIPGDILVPEYTGG